MERKGGPAGGERRSGREEGGALGGGVADVLGPVGFLRAVRPCPLETLTIDNGFFFARFSSKEDYEYAKYEGPWMIFNDYLTVSQWKANFHPNQNLLRNLLVWVRIPCLPIEYLDYNFLMRVGSNLGYWYMMIPVLCPEATMLEFA